MSSQELQEKHSKKGNKLILVSILLVTERYLLRPINEDISRSFSFLRIECISCSMISTSFSLSSFVPDFIGFFIINGRYTADVLC